MKAGLAFGRFVIVRNDPRWIGSNWSPIYLANRFGDGSEWSISFNKTRSFATREEANQAIEEAKVLHNGKPIMIDGEKAFKCRPNGESSNPEIIGRYR